MKLPFCRAALLAAALGVCLVGCKPAATDEPAAFATAETAEASATLTPTAATTAQPVAAEIGTVLPATEDAGRSYLDETLFIGDSNTVRYHDVRRRNRHGPLHRWTTASVSSAWALVLLPR